MKPATSLLLSLTAGDRSSIDQLMPLVYEELRNIAARRLRQERTDHTLQPTALVNEAFLRMADQKDVDWQGKAHFCAVAANMMRRILVDHARQRNARKRQGGRQQVSLQETLLPAVSSQPVDIVALDDLLDQLAALNERQAKVFELRCFGGLEVTETAQVLEVSAATVKNDWRFARAWLASQMTEEDQKDTV
ncbi:MAG: sigma-70 family RNA polymerase sigma factor [Planctomycetaceae bacterium]|nr:sigma-70 family RNA polymerase sigma factor [Planctomycetaceae bacterium]